MAACVRDLRRRHGLPLPTAPSWRLRSSRIEAGGRHEAAQAGYRLDDRLGSSRPALARRSLSDLGRVAAELPDRPHRAVPRRLSADPLPGRARHRPRHHTLLVPPRHRARSAPEPPIPSPPITSDPPHHKPYKQLLLPLFTAEAMTGLEPKARAICNELIDKFIADGHCDAAQQYTRHIPVRVIAHMLGVPETDSDQFIKWIHEILELGVTDEMVLMQATREMAEYFVGHIAERRNRPKDDLMSQLLAARIDGKPLDDLHLNGMLRLLLIAGIDTTWSGIGAALWHLARTPTDRDRLNAEPALMPTAI